MTPTDIQQAFEERQRAVHALRDLATEAADREFTAEETEVLERTNAAIDALDSRIDTGLRAMEKEAKATAHHKYVDPNSLAYQNAVLE